MKSRTTSPACGLSPRSSFPAGTKWISVSTDPKDNPVLACAIEGLADYVVTDDRRDLLPLKVVRLAGHAAIQIVSAAGFLRILHD